jgi:hypothetical protein
MAEAAQQLFELANDLADRVEDSYASQKWANDLQWQKAYARLLGQAQVEFPDDPIIGRLPSEIPHELDLLIGKDDSRLTTWVRAQLGQLLIRLSQLTRQARPRTDQIKDLNLDFMEDPQLRAMASNDFVEAQRAYYANAPKAAALLCGSTLEAMLVASLRRPSTENDSRFRQFLSDKKMRRIDWNRASLGLLLDLAGRLNLVRPTSLKLASGTVDFRDTVHPLAELRMQRAGMREATLLIQIVDMVAGELAASHI